MLKVIQSPAKYLQGPDAAVLFGQYAKNLAESFFVIADDFVMKLAGEKVVNGLQSHDIRCHAERFNGSAVVKPSIPRRRSVTTRSCRWW